MSILVVGINKHVSLSMGTCNLIVAIFEIIIGTLLYRKNTTWFSVILMFVSSYLIDFANIFVIPTDNMVVRFIYMFAGVILYCLGLGMQQSASVGYGNFDIFICGIKEALHIKKYHRIKWVVDAVFILGGYLLGAEVGIGTVLLLAFAGVLIEEFKELTNKYIFRK